MPAEPEVDVPAGNNSCLLDPFDPWGCGSGVEDSVTHTMEDRFSAVSRPTYVPGNEALNVLKPKFSASV